MTIHTQHDVTYITSKTLDSFGIKHGFFMRHGGCSPKPWDSLNMATSVGDSREHVIENRTRIADVLDLDRDFFFDLWQVHSTHVVTAEEPRKLNEPHTQADAIVTDKLNVALLMLFADCVPILFFDNNIKVIASAHAGWKGTLNEISGKVVSRLVQQYGCALDDITAVIGPSICRDHYQIGAEVVGKAKNLFDEKDGVWVSENDKVFLDLPRANRLLLERIGVKAIETIAICTACHTEDWFSHRGENGLSGRFATVISL